MRPAHRPRGRAPSPGTSAPRACLLALAAAALAGCAALPESVSRDARMAAARQRAAASMASDPGARRAAPRAAPSGPAPADAAAASAQDFGALPSDYRDQLREAYRRYLDLPPERYDLRFGRAYRAVREAGAGGPARAGWAVPVTVEEDIGGADGPAAGRRKGLAHLSFYDPAARAFEPPVPVWKLPQLQYLYREAR
ncbi:MAG: hypothetical protein PGN26_03620 [Xylophilus ampelinus]